MGGIGNGAAEEDWYCWDLNPGAAAMMVGWDPAALLRVRTTQLWGAPFAMWLRKQETLSGRKGVKGFLLVVHEKEPHGFGLTGDHGGNIADGAGNRGAT